MITGFKPLPNNIAVDPVFERNTYDSSIPGLVKPDQYKGRCTQGIVKYIGNGVKEKHDIKEGDYVFFSAYTGTLWNVRDELLIVMGASKVVGKRDMSQDERMVPGLYFKGVPDNEALTLSLSRLLLGIKYSDLATDEGYARNTIMKIISKVREETPIWPADYIQVINLLSQSIDDPYDLKELNPTDPANVQEEQ